MTFEQLKKDLPYAYAAFKKWVEENGIDGGSIEIDEQASEDFCKDLELEKIFCQSFEEADYELRQVRVKTFIETNHFSPKEYINMGRWESIQPGMLTEDHEIDDMKVRTRVFYPEKKARKASFVWAFLDSDKSEELQNALCHSDANTTKEYLQSFEK